MDGKIVELKEVGGGTDLSVLKDMEQGNWYELKLDADGNVKTTDPKGDARGWAVPLTFAAFDASTNRKYINNVDDVDKAVNAENTVIMRAVEATELTYKNGTLYTDKAQTKGFSVAPEVKTVLCLSDDKGNAYDDCDDSYTARKGLEDAIRNLDTNFAGELNVIFDKGDAVVVILVDKTGAKDGDVDAPGGNSGVDVNVVAKLGFDGTSPDSGAVYFVATGTDKITGDAKCEAVKDAYVSEYGASASKTEVKYKDKKDGTMAYNVYVGGVLNASFVEGGAGKLVAVPTAKKLWDNLFSDGVPGGEGEHNENTQDLSYAAPYNGTYGDFVSWDAEFTFTVADDGTVTIAPPQNVRTAPKGP